LELILKLNTHTPISYRPDIDGLRAIAVLAVVFYHAGIRVFSGGFIGVDVFFVISGYLITSLLIRDMKRGTFSFKRFWIRRVRRIFPALYALMIASAVSFSFVFPPKYLKNLVSRW
jgi:peptidoglycan/LPS O-acetylase OafA/YrhL